MICRGEQRTEPWMKQQRWGWVYIVAVIWLMEGIPAPVWWKKSCTSWSYIALHQHWDIFLPQQLVQDATNKITYRWIFRKPFKPQWVVDCPHNRYLHRIPLDRPKKSRIALDPGFAHTSWEYTPKPPHTKKELSPEVVGEGSWVCSRGM